VQDFYILGKAGIVSSTVEQTNKEHPILIGRIFHRLCA